MNKICLMGYIGKEPEVRYTTGQNAMAVARFSLATNRKYAREGQEDTDWFNVVAFGKTAENIGKYFHKGSRIALVGRVQTGTYEDKNGVKRSKFDVVIEEFDFVDKKGENGGGQFGGTQGGGFNPPPTPQGGFYAEPEYDIDEEDLPF